MDQEPSSAQTGTDEQDTGHGLPGSPGRIVLAATPIGNVGDASSRLVELLATADIVAAEDTRRLHRLVQSLEVTVAGRIISYHEHNEATKTAELLDQVRAGKTIVMVTDAGMPAVSDPGFRLVEGAVAAGLTVRPQWNDDTRELGYAGELVKRFSVPADSQEIVLTAFEEQRWAERIDDPLPRKRGISRQLRLRETVRRLNGAHVFDRVRFFADGRGRGIRWTATLDDDREKSSAATVDKRSDGH